MRKTIKNNFAYFKNVYNRKGYDIFVRTNYIEVYHGSQTMYIHDYEIRKTQYFSDELLNEVITIFKHYNRIINIKKILE